MANFNDLFNEWAPVYDQTVFGGDNEYVEVFEGYTRILEEISSEVGIFKGGSILEIGVGTGNLAEILTQRDLQVVGIEPSSEMRQLAMEKLPQVPIFEGHFLSIPLTEKFDGIVTSYAFHHLTYDEKKAAIQYLAGFLRKNGKLVIADTMFESIDYKHQLLNRVKAQGSFNLLNDLHTEYYELLDDILQILKEANFTFKTQKMNRYVWIITAELI